jgi:hypothetical protein
MVYTARVHAGSSVFTVDLDSPRWAITDTAEMNVNGRSSSHDSNCKGP